MILKKANVFTTRIKQTNNESPHYSTYRYNYSICSEKNKGKLLKKDLLIIPKDAIILNFNISSY